MTTDFLRNFFWLRLPTLIGLVTLCGLGKVDAQLQKSVRERISLDKDWRFQKDDPAGAGDTLEYTKIKDWILPLRASFLKDAPVGNRPAGNPGSGISYVQKTFDDSDWRQLDLPHDWGIEGPFKMEYPGATGKLPYWGVAWYRKHFDLPATDQGRRIYLAIDGAMSYATVWCNGQFVGGWPYGYASFQLDLTPYVKAGGENVLAIRLDNPPNSSRWYPGGGIYRNVWLVKTSPVHIAQWGTCVTWQEPNVNVVTTLRNDADQPVDCALASLIEEMGGQVQAQGQQTNIRIAPHGETVVKQSIALGTNSPAKLWTLADPHLYKLVSQVHAAGQLTDSAETNFGLRTVVFDKVRGLLLNGEHVAIHGVCLHADLGALGTAVNLRAIQRQIELLKAMGVNAIRTSHNPPAPELIDLCDRSGIMVMAEAFDCWKTGKSPHDYSNLFDDWSEADLRALVRHYRNDPSVIIWSIGNEIPDQTKPDGPAIARRLTGIVHEEDATRKSTVACNDNAAGFNGFQDGVDVFGINYFHVKYKEFHEANPDLPFLSSESSSAFSSRGEYFFGKDNWKTDFQVDSYDTHAAGWGTTPDAQFRALAEFPMAAGEFVWTGFDYLGEPTPYNKDSTNLLNYSTPEDLAKAQEELKNLGKIKPPSRSSYFGILDLAGFRKDRYYLYQSQWRSDFPMAHLLPHWNWPGREGQVTPVEVYTSGDEAELFLNGTSLGRKKKKTFEYRLRWDDVKYAPGELKVVAYKSGAKWAEDSVKTTGPAAQILLQPDRSSLNADGKDLAFITVTIADRGKLLVPRSKNLVHFDLSGPADIVAVDNGDATSLTSFQAKEIKAFNGLALVVLRTKPGQTGPITIRAGSDGLGDAQITLQSIPVAH